MMTITAKPSPLQGYLGEEREFSQWGASMREVTRPYAVAQQMDDVGGVWISSMAEGLPMRESRANLEVGDVIRQFDNTPVKGLEDFQKMYDDSVKSKEPTVLVQILRGRQTISALLEVKKYAPASEPGN